MVWWRESEGEFWWRERGEGDVEGVWRRERGGGSVEERERRCGRTREMSRNDRRERGEEERVEERM